MSTLLPEQKEAFTHCVNILKELFKKYVDLGYLKVSRGCKEGVEIVEEMIMFRAGIPSKYREENPTAAYIDFDFMMRFGILSQSGLVKSLLDLPVSVMEAFLYDAEFHIKSEYLEEYKNFMKTFMDEVKRSTTLDRFIYKKAEEEA